MYNRDDFYGRRDELVRIVDEEAIIAFERFPDGTVTILLRQRGLYLDLTQAEVLALATAMEKVVNHVKAKRWSVT